MLLQIQYVIREYKDKGNQCQPQIFHINVNWDFTLNADDYLKCFRLWHGNGSNLRVPL